jgi:hypothetical protein
MISRNGGVDVVMENSRVEQDSVGAAVAMDDDPREAIEVGVLMANGRLAGRQFASRAEAEAWARPDEGDQVVEFNILCECSFTS